MYGTYFEVSYRMYTGCLIAKRAKNSVDSIKRCKKIQSLLNRTLENFKALKFFLLSLLKVYCCKKSLANICTFIELKWVLTLSMSEPLCCGIICLTHGPSIPHIVLAVCFSFKSFYFMVFFTLVYLSLSTWVNEPTGVEGLSFFHFATDYDIALFDKCCSENIKCT